MMINKEDQKKKSITKTGEKLLLRNNTQALNSKKKRKLLHNGNFYLMQGHKANGTFQRPKTTP